MAITDIGFLTRPVGYSNGGDVFTPNIASQDLGSLENDPVMLDQAIKEFDPIKYLQNITQDADPKKASEMVQDRAVGEVTNALSDYLKKKGYKITFDVKGFTNWVMGKNPDGSSKFTKNPDGSFKVEKDFAKKNRQQLSNIFAKTPAGFVKNYIARQLSSITREVAPNLIEAINDYFTDDTKSDLQTGADLYQDMGGEDDTVMQNALIKKQNKFAELSSPSGNRKERIAYREEIKNDEGIANFLQNYQKFEDLQKSEGKALRISKTDIGPTLISNFADIYNERNIFKTEYIRSVIGERKFGTLLQRALQLPAEEGGVTEETSKFMQSLGKSKASAVMDNMLERAEIVLTNYAQSNPEATGYELKISNLGDLDIDDLLLSDPELAKYLTGEIDIKKQIEGAPVGIVASRNVRLNTNRKNTIINRLKKEGVFEKLGLDQYSIKGPASARSTDPQVLQYLEDNPEVLSINNTTNLFQKILTPDQRKPILDILTKTREQSKDLGLDYTGKIELSTRVDGNIQMNINRMLRAGLRRGLTIQEIVDKINTQINDPDFLDKFVPIMKEKVRLRDKIKFYKSKGVELDDVVLAHMKAVAEDLDLSLRFDNVFIGNAKPNSQEGNLLSRISQIKKELQQKNISEEKRIELSEKLDTMVYEATEMQKHIRIDDLSQFEKDADEKFKEVMEINQMISTQMRDGGIVSINKMIEPLRAER